METHLLNGAFKGSRKLLHPNCFFLQFIDCFVMTLALMFFALIMFDLHLQPVECGGDPIPPQLRRGSTRLGSSLSGKSFMDVSSWFPTALRRSGFLKASARSIIYVLKFQDRSFLFRLFTRLMNLCSLHLCTRWVYVHLPVDLRQKKSVLQLNKCVLIPNFQLPLNPKPGKTSLINRVSPFSCDCAVEES